MSTTDLGGGVSEGAVSSVVGTVLMLAVTMATFTAFGIYAVAYFQDTEGTDVSAQLAVSDGEEAYLVSHLGGEPVPLDSTTLRVVVDGVETDVPLSAFVGFGLEPGATAWEIGDVLCVTCYFDNSTRISGIMVVGANQVVGSDSEGVTDLTCTDLGAPAVAAPVLAPADLDSESSGPVEVTVTVSDECGTDDDVAPHLWWGLAGSVGSPATDAGAMTLAAPGTWAGTVPAQDWEGSANLYLLVQAKGVADRHGNLADSAVVSDLVTSPSDPGFPYLDTDGDGIYTPGVDGELPVADITDGSYDAGSSSLYIPASIGPITAASITFASTESVTIGTDVTATSGAISVTGEDVTVLPGITLESPGSMTIVNDAGTFTGDGASFVTDGPLQIGSNAGGHLGVEISLVGATIDNRAGTMGITLRWEDGDLAAEGATFLTNGAILIGGTSSGHNAGDIDLDGAVLDNTGGTSSITFGNLAGTITTEGATFLTKGAITVPAPAGLDVSGATFTASGASGGITLSAGGALDAANAKLTATGAISLSGVGATLTGACGTTTGSSSAITIAAGTGALSAAGPSTPSGCNGWTSTGSQTWTGASIALGGARLQTTGTSTDLSLTASTGAIDLGSATVMVVRNAAATVPSGSRVTVSAAVLDDANNLLNIPNPTSSYVTGTAATGYGVE